MKNYDFKDLMAFGVFILALLTFIFQFSKSSRHKKTTPNLAGSGVVFLYSMNRQPTLWAVVFLFLLYHIHIFLQQ